MVLLVLGVSAGWLFALWRVTASHQKVVWALLDQNRELARGGWAERVAEESPNPHVVSGLMQTSAALNGQVPAYVAPRMPTDDEILDRT